LFELQVLISIQSLILVDDPFFNEPGFQGMLGTPKGNIESDKYNSTVREATMLYAMAGPLSSPSPLFKTVIEKHFKLKGKSILHLANSTRNISTRFLITTILHPPTQKQQQQNKHQLSSSNLMTGKRELVGRM
jgi:hypothetical protein